MIYDNPTGKSAVDWYVAANPDADTAGFKSNISVDGLPAVQTVDGLNTYLAVGTKVYQIGYVIGTQQQMNFYTTYQLFLRSFIFIQP